tara:strand:- start:326 stop:1180 length:855 start_codon:yes stop_codon:yes gene_type:complete
MKPFIYFLQSIIIYLFFIIAKVIGINLGRKFFSFIFSKIGPFFKSRKIVNENLQIFNKTINEKQRKLITSNMWKNYGMTFVEYVFLKHFRKNSYHIKISGDEHLEKIIKNQKQAIFISGHFSNFELMSMEITKKNINLATIYRPLNNYFLNPFMEYLRRKYVCNNQIKKGINGVRDAIGFIKKNYSLALMIDQRVSEGEKIPFFGKPAYTSTLPAQLSLKFNLPIIPVFIERDENNCFKLKFLKEINPRDFNDKIKLSIKLNQIIEQLVLKNPNEWIWTHNRWK